jgi:CheY-like chemotaxis protein
MPVLSGIRATEIIREFENRFEIVEVPIIVLTGNATTRKRIEAKSAGVNDFLIKPISRMLLAKSFVECSRHADSILVIDDDVFCLEVTRQMLSTEGFNVRQNDNPIEALH